MWKGEAGVDDLRRSAIGLLERAKAGDKDAFGLLAEGHRDALLRLCFKMTGSHETAEDLVQETLLKAYLHIAEFELRASLQTWLYRIATNACLDHQRARKPWDTERRFDWFRENGELVHQMEQTLFLSPERAAEVKEVAATCINCISMSLPEKQRAAIVLCDQIGLSREEAAKSIGASVASVKTELHRARKKMADVFEHHCQLVDPKNDCNGCTMSGNIKRNGVKSTEPPAPRLAATNARKSDLRTARQRIAARTPGIACAQAEALLSDLIDDQLAADARSGVETHIASCDRCRERLRALRRSVRFVQANSASDLRPRTPGGAYQTIARAMSDDTYGQSPTQTMLRELSRIDPTLLPRR